MSGVLDVGGIVAAHAGLTPDKIGARDSRRTLTFSQWNERSNRLANALLGLGLARGDRVALLAYNRVEWLELYVALAKAGLVAVPINFRLVAQEVAEGAFEQESFVEVESHVGSSGSVGDHRLHAHFCRIVTALTPGAPYTCV